MINIRKTGAFISERRKVLGLTQAELAEQLNVSPQAVSKWETGQALPDAQQLLSLSRLAGVTVDELLLPDDPSRPASAPETTSAASDAVVEAPPSEGDAQPQAEMYEAMPHGEPHDIEAVIGLAPFVGREGLREIVATIGIEAFTADQIAGLAPFLPRDIVASFLEQHSGASVEVLQALAPFATSDALDVAAKRAAGRFALVDLVALAPFVSRGTLGELLAGASNSDANAGTIAALAPFMPRDDLERWLTEHPPRSLGELEEFAPFLRRDAVSCIAAQIVRR